MFADSDRLSIIYEDNHLLVVDKPTLLPTMGVGADQDSLLARAKAYLKRKYNKPGNVYLGVVSRLDSHSSGLVVFARTSKAASRLTRQFQSRTVTKRYLAIVPGELPATGHWCDWVWKNDSARRMEASATEPGAELDRGPAIPRGAKLAELVFRVVAEQGDRRLVEIDLATGRKHQIRVQFASRGHPLLGDRKYGSSQSFPQGLALHAWQLKLEHPTLKRSLEFECPPPGWWPKPGSIGRFLRQIAGE